MQEISFKSISRLWPIPPVLRLGEHVNQDDPSLSGHVPLTVQEDTNRFLWSVARSWRHHCVDVWCLGMLLGWLLEVFLFLFNSPSAFYHTFIIGWMSLHEWRQAKEASFGKEKWILWARPSAGINHACSWSHWRHTSYFTEEAAMCSLWLFFLEASL